MFRVILVAFLSFFSLLTTSFYAVASPQPAFICDVSPHPKLVRGNIKVGEYLYHYNDFIGLTGYPEPNEKLPRVQSGSGEQFSDGVLTVHLKGDRGILIIENGPTYSCRSVANEVLEKAVAIDTIIRATPDVSGARIEKLPKNEPVELIAETGNYYQDFQWYKVRYGEGQEGYAWGGTMCVDTELSGILIDCRRFLNPTNNNTNIATPNSGGGAITGQSLFGSIVRSSPNAGGSVAFKIGKGTPITVIKETASFHDGWQWVEISVANRRGFVWGGTICTLNRQITGVHFGCQN